jgi:hypothetical protein
MIPIYVKWGVLFASCEVQINPRALKLTIDLDKLELRAS